MDWRKLNMSIENNIYGILIGFNSIVELANIFSKLGWSVRKSSFSDFEIENERAQLELIDSEHQILVSGLIDFDYASELVEILELH
jgi:hypothetical protein